MKLGVRTASFVAAVLVVLAPGAHAGQGPSVEILEPPVDAAVAGPDVRVRVEASGVGLGRRGRNGAHVLLQLDDMPAMKSYAERFTFRSVGDGEHRLEVELRRPDGAAFEPAVTASTTFTVASTGALR